MANFILIDLGTTNIKLDFIENGQIIKHIVEKNTTSVFGKDVITRLYSKNKTGLEVAQKLRAVLDSLIGNNLNALNVDEILIAGNAVMISLLLGLNTSSLDSFPFRIKDVKSYNLLGSDLDLFSVKDVMAYIPLPLGGMVGSDFLSVVISSFSKETTLLFDVGTNTEIGLLKNGHLFFCSVPGGSSYKKNNDNKLLIASIFAGYETLLLETNTVELDVKKIIVTGELGIKEYKQIFDFLPENKVDFADGLVLSGLKALSTDRKIEHIIVDKSHFIALAENETFKKKYLELI